MKQIHQRCMYVCGGEDPRVQKRKGVRTTQTKRLNVRGAQGLVGGAQEMSD